MRQLANWWEARAGDAKSQRRAEAALAAMRGSRPALAAPVAARIGEYAQEVLGSQRFAPWLRVYATWSGGFHEGWIPENYFARVVQPRMQQDGPARISTARTLAARVLMTDRLPDLAYCIRGAWLDPLGQPLALAHVVETVFAETDSVLVKYDRVARGTGVYCLRPAEFVPEALAAKGNFVVQRRIDEAQTFQHIAEGSAATLRITTVKPLGGAGHVAAAMLCFGAAGERSLYPSPPVHVPIIDGQGHLGAQGLLQDWTPTATHPESGTVFEGHIASGFAEAQGLSCELQSRVPHVEVAQWDWVVDRDQRVWLMDWTPGVADIARVEATAGPCFQALEWSALWRNSAPDHGIDQRLWRASA